MPRGPVTRNLRFTEAYKKPRSQRLVGTSDTSFEAVAQIGHSVSRFEVRIGPADMDIVLLDSLHQTEALRLVSFNGRLMIDAEKGLS